MAPHSTQPANRTAARGSGGGAQDGTGRVRNANTGAGVASRRTTGVVGSHAQRHQRTPRGRGGAGLPQRQTQIGRASAAGSSARSVTLDESRSQEPAARTTSSVANNEIGVGYTTSKPTTTPIATPRLALAFSGSRLTRVFPESQRRVDYMFPAAAAAAVAAREASFTTAPTPIRMLNNAVGGRNAIDGRESGALARPGSAISGQAYAPLPLPPTTSKTTTTSTTKPLYTGKDAIKRAVSNPKLRAILSDKPYPKQRKKVAAERVVLKMGVRREYK